MAEQSPAPSGADRIRSLTDDDAIFQAFDAYPWTKDPAFMSGLDAILGDPSPDRPPQHGSPADIATHARIFYYAQRIGVTVDFAAYQSWLARHPDHRPPQILPDEHAARDSSHPALPWQQAAPKADLFVDKTKTAAPSADTAGGGEPNYPMGFAEMLRLLQEGQEIPGIRQIPNTVARDPSVKPVGARTVPRKPWEKDVAPSVAELDITKALDTDFPPLDTDSADS